MNRKIRYNKKTSKKYGWKPSWFGVEDFNVALVQQIKFFQEGHDLKGDGLCGPATFRRISAHREWLMSKEEKNIIICNSQSVPINWNKVVHIESEGALLAKPGSYKDVLKKRTPNMIVLHWDAALSASSALRILNKRELSTHFIIDNDGTIYQSVDTQDQAYHAGKRVNKVSIGIDLSNAYYTKYQSWYRKRGFGNRPIVIDSRVHGRNLHPHLGFYDVQLDALGALCKTLCNEYDISLNFPRDENGNLLTTVIKEAKNGKYNGIVNHYNISEKKIDCAGLPLGAVIHKIK